MYHECQPVLQIDMAQDQVQHAKNTSVQKPCAASTEQLRVARQQRDREQEKLVALLMTRELIVSATREVHYIMYTYTISLTY